MKLKCDVCGNVLEKPGALYFSPPSIAEPEPSERWTVVKRHICCECNVFVEQFFQVCKRMRNE